MPACNICSHCHTGVCILHTNAYHVLCHLSIFTTAMYKHMATTYIQIYDTDIKTKMPLCKLVTSVHNILP